MRWSQFAAESLPIHVVLAMLMVAPLLAAIVSDLLRHAVIAINDLFEHAVSAIIVGGIVGGFFGLWAVQWWAVDPSWTINWPWPVVCALVGAKAAAWHYDRSW